MTSNRSNLTSEFSGSENSRDTTKKSRMVSEKGSRKANGDHNVSKGTARTKHSKERLDDFYDRVTADEYFVNFAPTSGSSESYCSEGKYYSKDMLKNFEKGIVEIPTDQRWTQRCKPAYGWDMAERLVFLVTDPTVGQQKERLANHLKDFAKISNKGYIIKHLHNVCTILDYLIETLPKNHDAIQGPILTLFRNIAKPVLLESSRDIIKYHDEITHYMGFLGYLLMRLEDDAMFDIVSDAMIWHLSAPDSIRGNDAATLRHTLIVAAPVLYQTTSRMLAVATSHRFPTFMKIALMLACSREENCIELLKENIIENIFYRFNPYFPDRKLGVYDINPADPQDINVKLGDSSVHMSTTLSLLLVLLKTVKKHLVDNPQDALILPCPDYYSQSCFIWAYRFECRGRERQRQRNTLTVIAMALLHSFRDRLRAFSSLLMADILTLSVITELPPRNDWISGVNFNTAQQDVQFKKLVIYFSVELLKVFPENNFMVESRHWLLGLMYLVDPGLCYLRARWSPALFSELRKTALQALVCAIPRLPHKLVKEHGLPRRILWYIEWYSESPFELPILYWCVRLLHIAIYHRSDEMRRTSLQDLYDTHGIIILIHLCNTLLKQKVPPVEMAQVIIGFCLRLLTSAVESNRRIVCCVYPNIKWPSFIIPLTNKMLDVVLYSLEKNYILSDRWIIALLNFIWEGVIWQPENRKKFVTKDGIYKLLDLITMTRAPVQCIALALVCDAARAGNAVAQLVTWRANLGASHTHPNVVKRGATIATLLASIFRDECLATGVQLDHNGVIQDLDSPIMSLEVRKEMTNPDFRVAKSQDTPVCLVAGDLAGSRMSKVFAILHLLSEDLQYKVSLADEAFNLYKNIRLEPEDETILILCTHYLTLKLNEVWVETNVQSPGLLPHEEHILEEFLDIGKGWSKEIKRQQNDIIQLDRKKAFEDEISLYEFLGRVRLNIALDALREVRCVARSADRARITHTLLQDAVRAHHRRSLFYGSNSPIIRTYRPKLDDQNITGQNLKVQSIHPKDKPKPLNFIVT